MINLIAAINHRRVIGKDNDLVWKLNEDLDRFRRLTKGRPIIMGRKTWESLPRKPLPGRTNIVVSRTPGYGAEGATIVPTIEEALALAKNSPGGEETWVIGGEQIYTLALPFADLLYLTIIDDDSDDPSWVHFPPFSEFSEVVTDPESDETHVENGVQYRYVTCRRPSATS